MINLCKDYLCQNRRMVQFFSSKKQSRFPVSCLKHSCILYSSDTSPNDCVVLTSGRSQSREDSGSGPGPEYLLFLRSSVSRCGTRWDNTQKLQNQWKSFALIKNVRASAFYTPLKNPREVWKELGKKSYTMEVKTVPFGGKIRQKIPRFGTKWYQP